MYSEESCAAGLALSARGKSSELRSQCTYFNNVFETPHQHGLHMQSSHQSLSAHSLEMKKKALPYKKESSYFKNESYHSSGRSFAGRQTQGWIISNRMWSNWQNEAAHSYLYISNGGQDQKR